jgi:hypothetical protein
MQRSQQRDHAQAATESGTLVFKWTGDNGFTATESVTITIS